jgi:internalin A
MILGNGRVGKTQICRRLRGKEYDDTQPSTHGIHVSSAPLALSSAETITLMIWDFGGQDIYHGTHALFLKSRALFPLIWTPESEAAKEHEHGGFTFRNQPLGYWLAYVRTFGGPNSPVLVIQSQCDEPEQERLSPPVPHEALDVFPFKKLLHYGALNNRGRAALDEALADAVRWLRRQWGVDKIGSGRAEVKSRLEGMHASGTRLITHDEFLALCEEVVSRRVGNISSPELLLDFLHNTGAVFYRRGLFGDAIILDQAWALQAVYAVFDRNSKAFRNIERYRGRFRRSDLAQWVWQEHGEEEQKLFLSFMQQCCICFVIRGGDRDIEAEYIAPDLLPGRDDPHVALELRQKWDDRCDAEATLPYDLLPPGLMRSLISKIGHEAGLAAEYWRDGFYFYDERTGSKALVEQRWTDGWAGEIRVRTQRGQAELLLKRVLELIDEEHEALGARPRERSVAAHVTKIEERELEGRPAAIKPAHEPSTKLEYFVSYAWGDDTEDGRERELIVNQLCDAATGRGITIIRDKTAMHPGDRISKFMERIGRGDRVFIVLSDKYLKSTYCMTELFEVWRNCREEDSAFIEHTRVYVRSCAKIGTLAERTQYVLHWRAKFEEMDALVKAHGPGILAAADLADYRRMETFVGKTPDMLRLVQDVLRPREFEEFVEYGFNDPPKVGC